MPKLPPTLKLEDGDDTEGSSNMHAEPASLVAPLPSAGAYVADNNTNASHYSASSRSASPLEMQAYSHATPVSSYSSSSTATRTPPPPMTQSDFPLHMVYDAPSVPSHSQPALPILSSALPSHAPMSDYYPPQLTYEYEYEYDYGYGSASAPSPDSSVASSSYQPGSPVQPTAHYGVRGFEQPPVHAHAQSQSQYGYRDYAPPSCPYPNCFDCRYVSAAVHHPSATGQHFSVEC